MAASNSAQQIGSTQDRTEKWFTPTVVVPAPARELLENYSHIPPAEVEDHLITLVSNPAYIQMHYSFSFTQELKTRLSV